MRVQPAFGAFRCSFLFLVAVILLIPASPSLAVPSWYTAGTGGFVANTNNPAVAAAAPTIPDFYQHQYWTATAASNGFSPNGWETQSANSAVGNQYGYGWCGFTSYTDLFYDLASQGYQFAGLNNPLGGGWFNATYGPSNKNVNYSAASNIGIVANYFAQNTPRVSGLPQGQSVSLQRFLNASVNTNAANNGLPALTSQIYPINNTTGLMSYWSYSAGKLVQAGDVSSASIFNATNLLLSTGSDLMYQLYASPATIRANGLWWAGHAVAVAGININQNPTKPGGSIYPGGTVYIADPDSNPTYVAGAPPTVVGPNVSGPSTWPRTNGFPAAGQVTPPGALLPVPANPAFNNAASYSNYYDDFNFNKSPYVQSNAAPSFNNAYVADIYRVAPSLTKNISVKKRGGPSVGPVTPDANEDESDITIQVPADEGPVDGVIVEPSMPVTTPSTDPTADTLVDDTHNTDTWTDVEDATDPFGNALNDDAVEYDLTGGNPLEPGDTADIDIATEGDFSSVGYDVLLHFAGDDSDQWLPEQIGGSEYDPSDDPAGDDVPEPGMLMPVLVLGALVVVSRRRCTVLRLCPCG